MVAPRKGTEVSFVKHPVLLENCNSEDRHRCGGITGRWMDRSEILNNKQMIHVLLRVINGYVRTTSRPRPLETYYYGNKRRFRLAITCQL